MVAALGDLAGMGSLRNHVFMVLQFSCALAVPVVVRWTGFGRDHAGWVFAAGMTAVSAAGAAHVSQFGGLDGPYFYGSYTAPPVMIPMLLTLRARFFWTGATVFAFIGVYTLCRPGLWDHPMAHIPLVYLLTISGISISLGNYVYRLEVGSFVDVVRLERAATHLEAQLRAGDGQPARLREEIARQLHDDVAQLITGARIHLDGWAQPRAKDEAAARLAELLDELGHRARRMMDDLRTPPVRGPLSGELSRLQAEYGAMGLTVDVLLEGVAGVDGDDRLVAAQEEVLLTTTREALTNARRHGLATEATVSLVVEATSISLQILDNGTGKATNSAEGYGLQGIRERLAALQGTLDGGNYEEGFRLAITLPRRMV